MTSSDTVSSEYDITAQLDRNSTLTQAPYLKIILNKKLVRNAWKWLILKGKSVRLHVYFGQWRVSRSLLGWSCVHTTDARHCFFVINRVKTLVWGTLNSQTNIVTTCTWFLKMFYHTVYIKPLGLFLHCNLFTATYICLLAMLHHFLTQRDAFFLF